MAEGQGRDPGSRKPLWIMSRMDFPLLLRTIFRMPFISYLFLSLEMVLPLEFVELFKLIEILH